jgi:hypothetical protein
MMNAEGDAGGELLCSCVKGWNDSAGDWQSAERGLSADYKMIHVTAVRPISTSRKPRINNAPKESLQSLNGIGTLDTNTTQWYSRLSSLSHWTS